MTNGKIQTGGRSAKRFERALVLLSLDLTVPFFAQMGLEVLDKTKFVSALRDVISKSKHIAPALSDRREFVKVALQLLENELPRELKSRLMHWVTHEYEDDPSDYPDTRAWLFTLAGCAGNPDRWARLDLSSDKKWLIHREFRAGTTSGDIDSLIEQQRLKPQSQWDVSALVEYGFDNDALDPFLWISNTIDLHRFRAALRTLLNHLSEDEIVAFWKSVESIRGENGLARLTDPRQTDKLETDWQKETF